LLPQTTKAGWREWLSLPDFNVEEIEAKVDTGTETSVLYASFIEPFRKQGKLWLRFGIHPLPERTDIRMIGFAPMKERRLIRDAEGHEERCFVIETAVLIGDLQRNIELSLTTKDAMTFRMVLGRSALQELNLLVDSSHTHLLSPKEVECRSSVG